MSLYDKLAASHPKLAAGVVYCHTCRREQRVNAAGALARGWPKCCGYTMSLDTPPAKPEGPPRA